MIEPEIKYALTISFLLYTYHAVLCDGEYRLTKDLDNATLVDTEEEVHSICNMLEDDLRAINVAYHLHLTIVELKGGEVSSVKYRPLHEPPAGI